MLEILINVRFLILIRDYEKMGVMAGDEPSFLEKVTEICSDHDIVLTRKKAKDQVISMEAAGLMTYIIRPGRHIVFRITNAGRTYITVNGGI